MSEPTLHDVLQAIDGLGERMARVEAEVRLLCEEVKTLDAVQLKRFNQFRKDLPALVNQGVSDANALRERIEEMESTQDVIIAALQGDRGAKEDVRNWPRRQERRRSLEELGRELG